MFDMFRHAYVLNTHRVLTTSLDNVSSRPDTVATITKTQDPEVRYSAAVALFQNYLKSNSIHLMILSFRFLQEYFGPAQCTVIAVLGLSSGTC